MCSARMAHHKSVFFRSGWAKYDEAVPGTLHLSPAPERVDDFRKEYRDMAPMMFDDPPADFDEILRRLYTLEKLIHGAVKKAG